LKTLRAGATYFACVFAAGFVLGIIRVLLLVPRVGVRTAELVEMPFMLAVIVVAARWIVRRFALPAALPARLSVGLLGLTLLLATEFGVVLRLQGRSLAESLAERDPVSGAVYALLLLLFAVMPALVRRDGAAR
jgi:hypothetical protein